MAFGSGHGHRAEAVAVDFDGVIHEYRQPWRGDGIIPDPPVPGIREQLVDLARDYRIVVFSTRAASQEGRLAIRHWMSKNRIPFDEITDRKPQAACYIDDRGIGFDGNAAGLADKVRAFVPWTVRARRKR